MGNLRPRKYGWSLREGRLRELFAKPAQGDCKFGFLCSGRIRERFRTIRFPLGHQETGPGRRQKPKATIAPHPTGSLPLPPWSWIVPAPRGFTPRSGLLPLLQPPPPGGINWRREKYHIYYLPSCSTLNLVAMLLKVNKTRRKMR